jgi:hypothetical protein
MRRSVLSLGVSSLAIAFLAGCTTDDTSVAVPVDGGSSDAAGQDATIPPADSGARGSPSEGGKDAATDAAIDAADAGIGPYLLVTYYYDGYDDTGYSAFNVATGETQGSVDYTGTYGVAVSTNESPWFLDQGNNVVYRMNPKAPWEPTSSWEVSSLPLNGSFGVTPWSVVEVGTKAYVLGYASDSIGVLDTSSVSDGGAPTKAIALTQFAPDAGDAGFGNLQATALAYDSAQNRAWVLLANTNSPGGYGVCGTHPFLVAIDTLHDTVVSGVQYTLQGYGVPTASNVAAFDAVNDRLFVVTQGCNEALADGGTGPLVQSNVEQISLAGANAGTDTVLSLGQASGQEIVYVDATHAFVQTSNGTNEMNPATMTLGAAVAHAPDTFVSDGKGNLLGPQSTLLANDAGVSIAVVQVNPADGGVTTLATNPFTPAPSNPFAQQAWQSVDVWPRP